MKILVTGAAGFIGYHFVMRVLDSNEVVCVDNMNSYYDPALKEARLSQFADRVKFYRADISDLQEMEKIFSENSFDAVCHFAAQAGVRYSLENPFAYGRTNYMGTLNLFELCRRHNVLNIVFASTSSVYGDMRPPFREDARADSQVSLYAATKRGCELLARTYCNLYGMNITSLRFFTVYGPWGRPDMAVFRFTKNIIEGRPIEVYNRGDMERDFTYVSDIVDGFALALNKPMGHKVINLGCAKPIRLLDFIGELEKALGKKAKMKLLPMQKGDIKRTHADITLAQELLGYMPRTNLKEGIKMFVDWFRSYYCGQNTP